jgi:putative ABC transport system permease protein
MLERLAAMLALKWRSAAKRRDVERDLDDELADHLERRIDDFVRRGVARPEAERLARAALGGVDQVRERCRDARGLRFVETLTQDLRYGVRALRRDTGFTVVAVVTLALGFGANSAVFSLVDGILLTPLPYPGADGLVSATGRYPAGAFAALRRDAQSFQAAAYVEGQWVVLKGAGDPTRTSAARISSELFTVLGVRPALGRAFGRGEDEAGRDRLVVLSHALWQRRFHGDPSVIGRFLELDGVAREVVGVMPRDFRFPSASTELWIPLGIDAAQTSRYWGGDFMPTVGRLGPGRTIDEGRAELRVFQARIVGDFPWRMPPDWNQDISLVPLQEALVGPVRPRLLILLAAVLVVLLTACANVANLSLSRAIARDREIAVRVAVGAGPRRIARQLLTESLMLTLVAGVVGVLVGTQLLSVLKDVLPSDTPRLLEAGLNWRVLLATGLLAALTGCAFGMAPVARTLRVRLRSALEAGGRGGGATVGARWRAVFTVAQVACAVVLVVAAALLVRSFWSLSSADPGFRVGDVVTASISPPETRCAEPERCVAFYRDLEARLATSPGIERVALVNTLPLGGSVAKRSLQLEGYRPGNDTDPLLWLHTVTPAYFDVMGMRVESGRDFTEADRTGARVAIVSASTARRFWPGASAIGRHVRFIGEPDWRQVVGVVADVKAYDLTRAYPDWIDGAVYVPYGSAATLEDGRIPSEMALVMRTAGDAPDSMPGVGRVVAGLDRAIVVGQMRPMRDVVSDAVAAPAAITSLLSTLAAVALTLGAIGVYGVLSFLVAGRVRDFGIRLALGATPRALCWMVVREGGSLCAVGTLIGLAGSAALMRWLSTELHGVTPTDPLAYAGVVSTMALVSIIACWVPTRRAMRVNPLVALRDA